MVIKILTMIFQAHEQGHRLGGGEPDAVANGGAVGVYGAGRAFDGVSLKTTMMNSI